MHLGRYFSTHGRLKFCICYSNQYFQKFNQLSSKIFKLKKYHRGCIIRLSQTTFNPKENQFALNSNYTPFVTIQGEWSRNCMFDDETYWEYSDYKHYDLLRMKYTLQSDSTLREDLMMLKN